MRAELGPVSMKLGDAWAETTHDLLGDNAPFTLGSRPASPRGFARLTESPTATGAVALNYHDGNIGTPPSPQLGHAWRARAADLGREEPVRALRRERDV